jgi:ABC-type multidrug transport system fused ATPase/permease subunit
MYGFFRLRERHTTLVLLRKDFARNCLARTIEKVVRNCRLILDMSQRNSAIAESIGRIEQMNKAVVAADTDGEINQSFTPIITDLLTAMFVVVGGRLVLEGKITLGQFLANVSVYVQFRKCLSSIYHQVLKINDALPALEQVSRFLNLPIDLHDRRQLSNLAREENDVARQKARETLRLDREKGSATVAYAVDSIPIKLQDCCFTHRCLKYCMTVHGNLEEECKPDSAEIPSRGSGVPESSEDIMKPSSLETKNAEMMWSFEIKQASICAFVGKHGNAKSTLLKLLGGVFLPTGGTYFVPPQLRVCYVSEAPLFVLGSLRDNLAFGLSSSQKKDPMHLQRMRNILRCLQLGDEIVAAIDSTEQREYQLLLSNSQRRKLHLARAFVANPEFMVLDRPANAFDLLTQEIILDLIKDHVKGKGLYMDQENAHFRRPRTLAFSSDHAHACRIADQIFLVQRRQVIPVDHAEFHDARLYEEQEETHYMSVLEHYD